MTNLKSAVFLLALLSVLCVGKAFSAEENFSGSEYEKYIRAGNTTKIAEGLRKNPSELDRFFAIACTVGSTKSVSYLLGRGAKVDGSSSNYPGNMPIHTAAASGHLEVVKFLVSRGAKINPKAGSYYGTPLMSAVRGGYVAVVKYFLAHGANPNAAVGERRLEAISKVCPNK